MDILETTMKKSILNNVAQLFLIVFGVVLGIFLSERIEEQKNKKEATKLLSKIKAELNDNKNLLDEWAPYHAEIVENLDSFSRSETFIEDFIFEKTNLYRAFTKGTLMGRTPSNDAWDIAKSHPLIINIDYDELLILSKIYNQQKTTFESVPKLVEFILSADLNGRENAKSNLEILHSRLADIYSRELQLISFYNEGQEILNYQDDLR